MVFEARHGGAGHKWAETLRFGEMAIDEACLSGLYSLAGRRYYEGTGRVLRSQMWISDEPEQWDESRLLTLARWATVDKPAGKTRLVFRSGFNDDI